MNEFYNELNGSGTWAFVWGSADIEEIKKGLASIGLTDHVDEWLDMGNAYFNMESPAFLIENGYVDDIWRMIYEIGMGAIS